MDVARLVLAVDSTQVRAGKRDLDALNATGKRTETTIASLGRKFGAAFGGVAVVATIMNTVNATKTLNTALAEVSTLLDDIGDMPKIRQATKDLAREFGNLPVAQAKSFYNIISAGAENAAEANATLTAANKLAIGGVTSLETAVDGLTSTLNAYNMEGERAGEVSDAFFVAMRAGKTTIGEISSSIGLVATTANAAGVSLDELLAGISAITKGGVETNRAVTQLNQSLVSVIKPTSEAVELAAELGLEFNSTALASKGLAGFLQDVTEATGGNLDQMAKLFGSVDALKAVLTLTGPQAESFAQIIEQMGTKAGQTQIAYEKMAADMKNQTDVLVARIQVAGMSIGETVLKVLKPLVAAINENWDAIMMLAKAATLLISVHLAKWLIGVAVQMAINIQQSFAYQAALARMAGQSMAAATAAGVLRGALALLGGPFGLIALAAGGLVMWAMSAKSATEETETLLDRMKELSRSMQDQATLPITTAMTEAQEKIESLNKEIEGLQHLMTLPQYQDDGNLAAFEAAIAQARAEIGEYSEGLEALAEKLREVQGLHGGLEGDGGGGGNIPATNDVVTALKEQLATLGMTNEELLRYQARAEAAKKENAGFAGEITALTEKIIAKSKALEAEEAVRNSLDKELDKAIAQEEELNRLYKQKRASDAEVLKSLRDEIALLGLSAREKAVQINLRRLSADATDAEREAVERLTRQLYDETEAQREAEREAAKYADSFKVAWDSAIERLDGQFVDLWASIGSGAKGVMDAMKSSFKRMLAEMAHAAITRPIVVSMGLAMPGAASAGQGSAGGGLMNLAGGFLSGAGGLLGLSGLGGGLLASLTGGNTTGGAIGGALGGYGGMLLGSGALGGVTGALTGLLGSAGNFIIPGLGMVIGSLLPGLFGGKPSDKSAWGTINTEDMSVFDRGSMTGKKFSQETNDAVDAGIQSIGMFTQVLKDLGGSVPDTIKFMVGLRDGIRVDFGEGMINLGSDMEAAMETIFATLIEKASGLPEGVKEIFDEMDFADAMAGLQNLSVINPILEQLGHSALQFSAAGATAATELVNMSGGLEAFTAKAGFYYDTFYSAEEKTAHMLTSLTGVFEDFGLQLPATREGFRSLVEAQDLTTEAGRETYALLMELAPAFDTLATSLEVTGDLVDEMALTWERISEMSGIAQESVRGLFDSIVEDAQSAEEAMQLGRERSIAMLYDGITNTLLNSVSQLVMDGIVQPMVTSMITSAVDAANIETAASAVSATNLATGGTVGGTAVATGGMLAGEALAAIVDKAVTTVNAMVAVMKDPAMQEAINQIGGAMGTISGAVWTGANALWRTPRRSAPAPVRRPDDSARKNAERDLINAYKRQAAELQKQIDKYKQLGDSIRDFREDLVFSDLSPLTGAQKFAATTASYRDIANRSKLGDADALGELPAATQRYLEGQMANASTAQEYMAAYAEAMRTLSEAEGVADRQVDINQLQLSQLEKQVSRLVDINESVMSVEDAINRLSGVRGFASGGFHSGGLRIVGENGPELEATGAARYWNAGQTASMMGGSSEELVTEIRALRGEVADLKAAARATAYNTNDTRKQLQRWDVDGMPDVRVDEGAA